MADEKKDGREAPVDTMQETEQMYTAKGCRKKEHTKNSGETITILKPQTQIDGEKADVSFQSEPKAENAPNSEQPPANSYMREIEQMCIANGWKRMYKTGGFAVTSKQACKQMEASMKREAERHKG